jgi:hypothetical protein
MSEPSVPPTKREWRWGKREYQDRYPPRLTTPPPDALGSTHEFVSLMNEALAAIGEPPSRLGGGWSISQVVSWAVDTAISHSRVPMEYAALAAVLMVYVATTATMCCVKRSRRQLASCSCSGPCG